MTPRLRRLTRLVFEAIHGDFLSIFQGQLGVLTGFPLLFVRVRRSSNLIIGDANHGGREKIIIVVFENDFATLSLSSLRHRRGSRDCFLPDPSEVVARRLSFSRTTSPRTAAEMTFGSSRERRGGKLMKLILFLFLIFLTVLCYVNMFVPPENGVS